MKKTKRSMLNIVTSIIPSFILIIIGFLKFKFFINVYGDDLNGIVQLITQIYAYLSLAELGFGAATNVKLYKYFRWQLVSYDMVNHINNLLKNQSHIAS